MKVKNVKFSIENRSYYHYYYIGGIIGYATNSVIENCYIDGTMPAPKSSSGSSTPDMEYVGGVVGYAANTRIENVTSKLNIDLMIGTSSQNSNNIGVGYPGGGIAGYASGGQILSCINEGRVAVNSGHTYGQDGVGGIVGRTGSGLTIDRCQNTGEVIGFNTGSGSVYTGPAGGIVGKLESSKVRITNCWNKGYIAPYGQGGGGIVGLLGNTASWADDKYDSGTNNPIVIFNCLNTGKIWKSDKKQGIYESTAKTTNADGRGGIVGYVGRSYGAEVENCYNQGVVVEGSTSSSARFSGGMIGHTTGGSYVLAYINHSYLLDQNDGLATQRWYTTQSGSKGIGLKDGTKNYLAQLRASAETDCANLNEYASKQTVWDATASSGISLSITQTDESRDYAEWIYDPTNEINKGLPYLDLDGIGYNATPVPEVTYTLSYDANAEGEDVTVPADQTVTNKKGSASFRVSRDIPVRENYKFLGWADTTDAELADYAAGGTVTITAPTVQKTVYAVWAPAHKVMWVDGYDGSQIAETMAADGEIIPISAYPTDIPQHTEDSHYAGWSPEVKNADGSYTITAEWRLAVTWADGYSEEPVQAKYVVKYGDIESKHPSMNPTRRGYKFNGWEIGEKDEEGNVTVTAQWMSNPSYMVTWVDGLTNDVIHTETLSSDMVVTEEDYPEVPEHEGKVFIKWVVSVPDENGDITIIALYKDESETPVPDKYMVTWLDSIDNSVIETKDFALDHALTEEDYPTAETLPVHDGKVLDKWMVCPADAAGNITIIVLWKDGVPEDDGNYIVIWVDSFDGTKIKTQKIDANDETPIYDYPEVESLTPHEGLKFHRWVVNDKDENGNIVIVAMWIDENANPENPDEETYTVTWIDYDGSEIHTIVVKKGDTLTDDEYPENPVHDDKTFQEWVVKDTDENGNITYVAKYEGDEIEPNPPTPAKTYTVTWIDGYDGKVLAVKKVKEGEDISQKDYPNIPTHAGSSFVKWVESNPNGDDNIVYTATWKSNSTGGGGGSNTVKRPGGGGGSTISSGSNNNNNEVIIKDVGVPLAEAPGLNSTDHVAYVIGYVDGTVRPEANISRAEVATIFYRLMTDEFRSEHRSMENNFTDIENGVWYNNAVSTDVNAGLIKGYEDGSFAPDMNITRAEFAAIAARFLSEDEAADSGFTDIAGHWAAAEINRAVAAGWIRGKGDNRFAPDEYITRAEVMTLVNRMLNRVGNKAGMSDDMVKWTDNPEEAWYYADVQEATNSHEYVRDEQNKETWSSIMENKDWSELER